MSRNVCGSEALTAIVGFGVGKAIPNDRHRVDVFEREEHAALRSAEVHGLLVHQRSRGAASAIWWWSSECLPTTGRRTSDTGHTVRRWPPACPDPGSTSARSSRCVRRRRRRCTSPRCPRPVRPMRRSPSSARRSSLRASTASQAGRRRRRVGRDLDDAVVLHARREIRARSVRPSPAWRRARSPFLRWCSRRR